MKISVILPTFNRAHLIQTAIDSVLAQKYEDWELIIVDDGSTDNTKEVVTANQDDRIIYLFQENAERSVARNKGIEKAKGEWICFLDSDDYYLPNHLFTFSDFIKINRLEPAFLVSGSFQEINGVRKEKSIYKDDSGINPAHHILEKTSITPISVCIHKSCFEQHRFEKQYKKSYWEDTHLWIRLAMTYPFAQLPFFTNVIVEHTNRSVNSSITMERVNDHVGMIKHLFQNYSSILKPVFSDTMRRNYIDRKYRMFLYQARQNKQVFVSLLIWFKAISNRPSTYLLSELPKIFINKLNLGIHEK